MKKSYLKYIFSAIVIIGLIVVGVRYLNGEEVARAFRTFNYWYAPGILGLSLGYFGLKSWRFVVLMRPVSDLPWATIVRGYLAGQAAAVLPGGIAARAGLMDQAGGDAAKSGVPVILSSTLDQTFFFVSLLIATIWIEDARPITFIALGVILLVGVLLYFPTNREWLIGVVDWAASKVDILKEWRKFLKALPEVVSFRVFAITMGLTVAAFALQLIALNLALAGIDSALPLHKVFVVLILPTMLGRLTPIPGGFGVTEASMVGFLVSLSEMSNETAAASVAIFRVGTIVFGVLIGAIVYFFVWQGSEETNQEVEQKDNPDKEKSFASNT